VRWDERFAEPIVLDDGTEPATLREALAHLAEIITKAERNLPVVLTASAIVTKAAEQAGPVEFARSINRVRSILSEYIEPGRCGAVPAESCSPIASNPRLVLQFAAATGIAAMLWVAAPALAAENAVTASGPAATAKTDPSIIKRHAPRRAASYPIHSNLDCSGVSCGQQFVLMVGIGY
jgi:hypothetical protein